MDRFRRPFIIPTVIESNRISRIVVAAVAAGVILLLGGCGPAARVDLFQPQLAGLQAHLHIQSERAFWSSDERVERMLVEFPPPGASTGHPLFFLLYLRWPAGQNKPEVGGNQGPAVRGFLIQTRGRFAGLAQVVDGTLKVHRPFGAPETRRRFVFDLHCEDGSRLVGTVVTEHDDAVLKVFETRRRPADVANLGPAAATSTAPADAS